MMFKFSSLVLLMIGAFVGASTPVSAGPGSTGGGYMDFNGKKILSAAIAELIPFVESAETPELAFHPDRRAIALSALKNVQVRSKETRSRQGQALVMDYDLRRQRIIALKPFFEGFQSFSVTRETKKGAEQLILHEIAHLWGDDDIAADGFATAVLAALSPEASGAEWVCTAYCGSYRLSRAAGDQMIFNGTGYAMTGRGAKREDAWLELFSSCGLYHRDLFSKLPDFIGPIFGLYTFQPAASTAVPYNHGAYAEPQQDATIFNSCKTRSQLESIEHR